MANGAAYDDHDFVDDDAFDELPANTLHELEEQAFLKTQVPRTGDQARQLRDQTGPGSSQEYDAPIYDEEDVIDLNAEPISLPATRQGPARTGAHQGIAAQYGRPSGPLGRVNDSTKQPSRFASQTTGTFSGSQRAPTPQAPLQGGQDGTDVQALLAQVEELRQQNEALQRASRESQAAAQTKAGEAALLRRKIESTSTEYEKRLQRERETHAQAYSRQKAELDLAIKEKRQVENSNRFLENEARQAHDAAAPRRAAVTTTDTLVSRAKEPKQAGTPKKSDTSLPFRDGFDDEDMLVVSPSKARQKPMTPRKGGKRKRSIDRGPAKAGSLEFAEPAVSPAVSFGSRDDSERPNASVFDTDARAAPRDKHYELLQQLLNHKPIPHSKDRFIEAMAGFTFPASAATRLSSFIMESLQVPPQSDPPGVHAVSVLAATWRRCLDEAYNAPLKILISTIHFVLNLDSLSAAARSRHVLVPLVTRTVDLIAIPTGLAGKNDAELPVEVRAIEQQIDCQQTLELLGYICMACKRARAQQEESSLPRSHDPTRAPQPLVPTGVSAIESFWHMVPFDFILVLLMRSQPKRAMRTVLSLLVSSCLEDTFGTIVVGPDGKINQEKQSKFEDNTLYRLLDLLSETPRPLKGREGEGWDALDLAELRLSVLAIFRSMCLVQPGSRSKLSHGSKLLAHHPRAVGKLFRFLSDSLNLLYTYPPAPLRHFADQADDEPTPHALTARAINTTMRILHHLVTASGRKLDLRQKLAAVPGGHQRHLVALSRLAFSDQMLVDAGIDDASVDAAHEMLDSYLTYEEGEDLATLFSTPTTKAGHAAGEQSGAIAAARQSEPGAADVEMEAADTDDEGGDEL